MKTVDAFHKVGYIASELTQYVSPHMNCPSFDVSIKYIKLHTIFMRIGFYLTINISKKGSWHPKLQLHLDHVNCLVLFLTAHRLAYYTHFIGTRTPPLIFSVFHLNDMIQ